MNVLGVDPGQSGGIALVTDVVSLAWKMPDTERDVFDLLDSIIINHAYIEAVHAMPKQGVSSSFKFGQNYGFLRGCLISLHIPFEVVTPQKWQKALGCLTRGDKNVSKRKAQELYPTLKITHATADALLISTYGYRLREYESPPNSGGLPRHLSTEGA